MRIVAVRFGALLLAVAAAGCQSQPQPTLTPAPTGTAATTTAPPTGTPTASPSPTPKSSLPCGLTSGVWDPPTLDMSNLVIYYPTVVLATATGFGEPFWNTPDRTEPTLEQFRLGRAEIQTPLLVRDASLIRGEGDPSHVVIGHDGKIGCVQFEPVTEVPAVGEQYVMFLAADCSVWVIWSVSNGVAKSGYDGPIPLDELSDRLESAAATPEPSG
jgi:hypothetical protein